jgi:hypothetical protein
MYRFMPRLTCPRHKSQLKSLETKLEHIAQALSTKNLNAISGLPNSSISAPHRADGHPLPVPSILPQDSRRTHTPTDATATGLDSAQSESIDETLSINASAHEIEVLFDRYQRLMAPHMPFVILPPRTTARSLQDSEPFLLQAITTVASFHSMAQQQIMAKGLVRSLCERLFINGQKTLGLLQGILIFANWYNPHLYTPRNSTNILHLAMALISDLDLDRGPGEKEPIHATMKIYGISRPARLLSNDERRAVLGTFYLTSVLFTSFRKVDVLQWSPWLTECCNTLVEARDYESDDHLVQIVQMQRIMQEAMFIEHSNAPIQLYANSFLGELDALGYLSSSGGTSNALKLQAASTKVAIWQRAFVGLPSGLVDSAALRPRLHGMWCCIEAIKVYMEVFMTLSVEDYPVVPFTIFGQFAFTFVAMVRAFSVQLNGWDAQALCDFVNFSAISDDAANRYDSVSSSQVDGLIVNNEAFASIATKLRWAKNIHEGRLAAFTSRLQTEPNLTSGHREPQAEEMTQHLTDPPPVATDSFGLMETDFDLWSGFDDPSQLWNDFDSSLVGL